MLSTKEKCNITVNGIVIENSHSEKLLGIKFDSNLKFNLQLDDICKRAGQKLNALSRITPIVHMGIEINRLHERCLRIIYNDKTSSFQDLLNKDDSVSIHNRNLQLLAIEMFKVKNGIAPEIESEIFKVKSEFKYNLRNIPQFNIPLVHTTCYGTESLSYLGPKLWKMVPINIREVPNLLDFKRLIKKWIPDNCPCRLCKDYIKDLGYLVNSASCP